MANPDSSMDSLALLRKQMVEAHPDVLRTIVTETVQRLISAEPGIAGISKSQVSVMAKSLDEMVEAFRNRPLDSGPYTYLWVDALRQRCWENSRVVNVATVIATAVKCRRQARDSGRGRLHRRAPGRPGGTGLHCLSQGALAPDLV